jgi:hypothetical protein
MRERLSGTLGNCGPNYSKGPESGCLNGRIKHGRNGWRKVAMAEPAMEPVRWDATVQHDQPQHGASRILDHSVLGPISDAPNVTISFDGVELAAKEGEPIAAALLAAGLRVFRTMPESESPRGGYCMVGRCSDCQVVVDGLAGVRSCMTPVRRGMAVQTQQGVGIDDVLELSGGAE